MGNVDRVLAMVLGGLLLLPLAACSRFRQDIPFELPASGDLITSKTIPAAHGSTIAPAGFSEGTARPADAPQYSAPTGFAAPLVFQSASAFATDQAQPAPAFAACGSLFEPTDPMLSEICRQPIARGGPLRMQCREGWANLRSDYRHYYDCDTMCSLLAAVGAGAVLANTSLDDDFHGWYQRDVRSQETDHFSAFWKTFGEGQIFIPAYAGLALVGGLFDDRPLIGCAGDFSDRVTRGYLVGTPPMLLMQAILGGSRPDECSVGSQWKPFDDNNAVSGHAFIGAVPFITGAKMVDNRLLKVALYTLSTFPAWSRVNDDAHYVSQACLGWWMAYMACCAVDDTERADRCYAVTPLLTPELTGLGLVARR